MPTPEAPQLAIFEVVGLLMAVPLSYGLAMLIKRIKTKPWRLQVEEVFQRNWNGRLEDEHYAWLKTRNEFQQKGGKRRQLVFIDQRIAHLNRRKLYSETVVSEEGIVDDSGSMPETLDHP
jgi:hypothetical protein